MIEYGGGEGLHLSRSGVYKITWGVSLNTVIFLANLGLLS
ncbi:MAG: hypothetical protein OJF47_004128 [Nitrospira sp.]|nr:MAG: hypothetical protein OJF47_004128 [Nitrospira sp.]